MRLRNFISCGPPLFSMENPNCDLSLDASAFSSSVSLGFTRMGPWRNSSKPVQVTKITQMTFVCRNRMATVKSLEQTSFRVFKLVILEHSVIVNLKEQSVRADLRHIVSKIKNDTSPSLSISQWFSGAVLLMTATNNLTWVFLGEYKNRRFQFLEFQMTIFQTTTTNNNSDY